MILSGRRSDRATRCVGSDHARRGVRAVDRGPRREMTEVVPGEVMADIGQLSGRPDLSAFDARAVGDVEAIVVAPEALRALLVAEAELGERILRALILRRVALIEMGFGGPVLVGSLKSQEVTRLSHFLERNAIPFWVIDPDEDSDGSGLLARFAAKPGELPIAILTDGTVLRNPTKLELARALGLVATSFRADPYDVAIVGAGPAGLATAVYGASEGLSVVVLEAIAFGGQAGASARIENYLGFPTGISGQTLMARAFTRCRNSGRSSACRPSRDWTAPPNAQVPTQSTSSSSPTAREFGRVQSWSPLARAIVVRRFRTSQRSRAAACPTGRRPSRRVYAAMRTWLCWAAVTLRARPRCSLQATLVTCGSSCAGPTSRAPCPGTSSNGSRAPRTSTWSVRQKSWNCWGRRNLVFRVCGGATARPGPRKSTPSLTCSSSRAPNPAASWLTSSGVPLDEKGFIPTGADVRIDRASAATARDRYRGDFCRW